MRIISNFHDYYDSLNNPTDDLIYKRDQQEFIIENREINSRTLIKTIRYDKQYRISHGFAFLIYYDLIGFCGKFYIRHVPKIINNYIPNTKIKFKISSVEDYITQKSKNIKPYKKIGIFDSSKYGIAKEINQLNDICNYFSTYFIDYKVPYFVINTNKDNNKFNVILNYNNLKNFEFQKIYDPYIAFQEIEMFVGTFLPSEKEIVQIKDNKVLLECKGFDNKTSFRHPIK